MTGHHLSRRRLLGTSAGVAAALALGAPGAVRRGLAQSEVTLDVFVHTNHPFDPVKPIYEAQYPNVKLNMMDENDMAIFRATLAAKGEGTPDIFWPEIEVVQELGKTGVLLDTTALVEKNKANMLPGSVQECLIASTGKYAAFPGGIAVVGLYYRSDLWEQAGVSVPDDWTWDDFIAGAKEVKAKTGAVSLSFPTTGDYYTAQLWSYVLFQLGGSITNADGTVVTLDDERGIAAMEVAKRLYDADIAIDENVTSENYFAAMAAGQVAGSPNPVWYDGFGIKPNIVDEQGGLGAWRVALLPSAADSTTRTANWGGAAIASTIYTEHPEEVLNFMQTYLDQAAAVGAWGFMPASVPYLDSEEWANITSPAYGDFKYNVVWTTAAKQYGNTWFKQPVFGEAMAEVGAAMLPIMDGSVEIAAGLKEVGDRVRTLNERYQV
jgi:ABC-type glycerol-3-phosphate transport system substrate-binding protein